MQKFIIICCQMLLGASLVFSSGFAKAEPFHHKFGELREYHKHWLSVCPDKHEPNSISNYQTTCWASTYTFEEDGPYDSAFPGYRLSIARNRSTGAYSILFVGDSADQIEETKSVAVKFSNGKRLEYLYNTAIGPHRNSLNEFEFKNQTDVKMLLELMKAQNYLTISVPLKDKMHDMRFSLVGVRDSIKFITNNADWKY